MGLEGSGCGMAMVMLKSVKQSVCLCALHSSSLLPCLFLPPPPPPPGRICQGKAAADAISLQSTGMPPGIDH